MNPDTFFNSYFLTEPYPSYLEMMLVYPHITDTISNLNRIASLTDNYPAIRISLMVGFDYTEEAQWLDLQQFVDSLKGHSSILSFGIEGEYFFGNLESIKRFESIVLNSGKMFLSYYHPPSPYLEVYHTNFPSGDSENILDATSSTIKGISAGYYTRFPFLETRALPEDPNTIMPHEGQNPYGWNQDIVNTVISHIVKVDSQYRLYNSLCVGYSEDGEALWNNELLRSWIWDNPDYKTNFILSTEPVTTTSMITTTTSTQSITTTTQTETQTITQKPIPKDQNQNQPQQQSSSLLPSDPPYTIWSNEKFTNIFIGVVGALSFLALVPVAFILIYAKGLAPN